MFMYHLLAGTTDVSVVIRIIDATDGTPETAVVFNTAGIDLEYRREGAATVDITEATLAALTTAHTDGGFLHIGNGYYRLDLPDAACAAGVTGVLVHGTVTGMVVIGCYVQLVAYNPFDSVRLGLTALPNAAAEAAGGLYTRGSGTGQINQPGNGVIDANMVAISGGITAADNLELAADGNSFNLGGGGVVAASVTAGVTVTTNNDKSGYRLSATGVDDVLDEVVEGSTTLRESMRLANAANGAKTDGAATTTFHVRDLADSKNRVTADVDADGNRTAVTRDLT